MKKIIAVAILPLWLVAVATPTPAPALEKGNQAITDPTRVSQLVIGKTTKAEVRALLGEPGTVVTNHDGQEKWVYSYTKVRLGLFAGSPTVAMVALLFDSKGILQKKASSQ